MTLVTIHTVVDIAADIGMIEVGSVISTVTPSALEDRVIAGVGVAGRADPIRVAVVDVEPRVIEDCPGPGCGRMAGGASRREPG